MKKQLVFALVLIFCSCHDKSDYRNVIYCNYKHYNTSKEFYGYDYERMKINTIDSNCYSVSLIRDSSIVLEKENEKESKHVKRKNSFFEIIYKISWNNENQKVTKYMKTENTCDSANQFNYFKSRTFSINNNSYKVNCIGHLGFETDGNYLLFMNSKFGLISVYSSSWDNLRIVMVNDVNKRAELNTLLTTLESDSTFFPTPKSFREERIDIHDGKAYFDTFEDREIKKLLK